MRFNSKTSVLSLMFATAFAGSLLATDFQADPSHSTVDFGINHMFTKLHGQFTDFKGTFSFDKDKMDLSKINFVIKADSVNTRNEKRDQHLKSPDFFETAKYPTLSFSSSKIKRVGKKGFAIDGQLNLHGVTQNVTFKATFNGIGANPWGQESAGFTATAKIDRTQFGMIWNKALDKKGLLIGNDVEIAVDIEATPTK